MATTIALVRHGQTDWNRVERFRGRADIPLDATGIEQAKAVGNRLLKTGLGDAIYSSPLTRCVQTAAYIAQAFRSHPATLDGIVDINYGDWQGLTPAGVEERFPELYRDWLLRPECVAIPGGETLDAVRDRAIKTLEKATDDHPDKKIVLVSHKVVCKVLMCAVLGLSTAAFWRIEQDNGAINLIERRDGAYTMKSLNAVCHLSG